MVVALELLLRAKISTETGCDLKKVHMLMVADLELLLRAKRNTETGCVLKVYTLTVAGGNRGENPRQDRWTLHTASNCADINGLRVHLQVNLGLHHFSDGGPISMLKILAVAKGRAWR